MQEMQVWSPGLEDPLEKEMAVLSNILDWEIPWTESLAPLSVATVLGVARESDTTKWLNNPI